MLQHLSLTPLFYWRMISHCIDKPHFIYPLSCWWTFGLLLALFDSSDNAAVKTYVQVFVLVYVSFLFSIGGELPNHKAILFNILRNCQTVFFTFLSPLLLSVLGVCLCVCDHPNGCKVVSLVFMCILLMTDIKFLRGLLDICISSLEKCNPYENLNNIFHRYKEIQS